MKDIFGTILNAVLWAVMALLLFLVVSGSVQRFGSGTNGLFGIGYAVVVSGSMEPNIHVGDMIVYQDHEASDYKVGDVVVYKRMQDNGEQMLITHRIESIGEDRSVLITRGDANSVSDPQISFNDVVGRVVLRASGLGFLVDFIKKPLGIAVAALIFCVLFAGNILLSGKSKKQEVIMTVCGEQKLKY